MWTYALRRLLAAIPTLLAVITVCYLLLHLTGVDMGTWQRKSAKWAIGTFVVFLFSIATFGGVRL